MNSSLTFDNFQFYGTSFFHQIQLIRNSDSFFFVIVIERWASLGNSGLEKSNQDKTS